ncbi:MAG: hypothetical protein HYZ53_10000 [Planctomycetes bacterium]|nr:hypothetical protein [Planctomycetota bacterium]
MIAASRALVCIRPATYESAEEAKQLTALFTGRAGTLENTVFALLEPDGVTRLARTGRSPSFDFRDAKEFAAELRRICARFPGKAGVAPAVPLYATVRLALDVAACDQRLLVLVRGEDKEADALLERLGPVAAEEALAGKLRFARAAAEAELHAIGGVPKDASLLVVRPGKFGLDGKVAASAPSTADAAALRKLLSDAVAAYQPGEKVYAEHVRAGRQAGAHWDTAIPQTDPNTPGGRRPPPPGGK